MKYLFQNKLKLGTSILIIFAGFLITQTAHGADLYSFTTNTDTLSRGSQASAWLQEIYPTTGTATNVTVDLTNIDASCVGYVSVFNTYDGNYIDANYGITFLSSSTPALLLEGLNTFTLNIPVSLTSPNYYGVMIESVDRDCYFEVKGSNSTKNGNDESTQAADSTGTNWTTNGSTRHMYVVVDDTIGATSQVTLTVLNSTTTIATYPDFTTWNVTFTAGTTTHPTGTNPTFGRVRVHYVDGQTIAIPLLAYDDFYGTFFQEGEEVNAFVFKTQALFINGIDTLPHPWVAQAFLETVDDLGNVTLIAQGEPIAFQVTASTDNITPYAFTTSTSIYSDAVLNCPQYQFVDTFFGIPYLASSSADRITCEVTRVVVKATQFWFIPGQIFNSVQAITTTLTAFKNVFPFGLYFTITTALEDSVSSTSTVDSIDIHVPSLDGGSVTNIPIVNATTLTDALTTVHCDASCAEDIKEQLFGYLRILIWGTAGVSAILIII